MSKRRFDIIVAMVFLVIGWPLMFAIALLVLVTSGRPILFRQRRLGKNREPFIILKFRTMHNGTGRSPEVIAHDDPRVTRIGKVLRSTHLDELPQICNVLRGDMSIVGPRPLAEATHAEREKVPGYQYPFSVNPGITGIEQVYCAGKKGTHWLKRRAFLNAFYIARQNPLFDLYLIKRTLPAIWLKKNA